MRFNLAAAVVALSTAASAAPADVAGIQKQAGGTLPMQNLPKGLDAKVIRDFSVIAENELFEVAYFKSLIHNVSTDAPGYTDLFGLPKAAVLANLEQVLAQEELHAIGVNAFLANTGAPTINPCKFHFPVNNFKAAIALANTFTDLALGVLQNVQKDLAVQGVKVADLVPIVGSVIGQEGEQNGAYRFLQGKIPSAAPFLTKVPLEYAANALFQTFVVPGSCGPEVAKLGIPTYAPLAVLSKPGPQNGTIKFSTTHSGVSSSNGIAYLSGQNRPVLVPISNIVHEYGLTTFTAAFPFDVGFAKGLTLAALAKTTGPYSNSYAVVPDTLAAPAIIEIQ